MLGIIPAAGLGSRIQPLAFSKEMLPVGGRRDGDGLERPKAVSELLVERMLLAGADRLCVVISAEKLDIVSYYARHHEASRFCFVIQERPSGLCDALFRALPLVRPDEDVLVGLPDTVWFPEDGLARLPDGQFTFLLFPVDDPSRFDAVRTDDADRVQEVQVKVPVPSTNWIWGAFRLPGRVFLDLHALWCARSRSDEYVGTLVNAYLRHGGHAGAARYGERYFDLGTLDGYRAAVAALGDHSADGHADLVAASERSPDGAAAA